MPRPDSGYAFRGIPEGYQTVQAAPDVPTPPPSYDLGIILHYNNVRTVILDPAGNLAIGSNVDIIANRALTLTVTDGITVGIETFGSGDLMLGSNAPGYNNLLYDASVPSISLRNGTTEWLKLTTTTIQLGQAAIGQSNVLISAGSVLLRNNITEMVHLDTTGYLLLGQTGSGQSNTLISSGAISIRNNTTDRVKLDSSGNLTIRDSGGSAVFTFDSSTGAEFTKPLTIGTSGGIYQGTGTFASPTTGLKIWNDTGKGRIGGYNSGTVQWYADTDGKLYAGGGNAVLDSSGITLALSANATSTTSYLGFQTGGTVIGRILGSGSASAGSISLLPIGSTGSDVHIYTSKNTSYTDYAHFRVYSTVGTENGLLFEAVESSTTKNIFSVIKTIGGAAALTTMGKIQPGDTTTAQATNYIAGTATGIGINQTAPSYVFDVTGTGRFTGKLLLGNQPMCRVTRSGSKSINNSALTAIDFDAERYDTDTMHDTVTNNSRITFTTAGKYRVFTDIEFASNATGFREVAFRVNGTTYIAATLLPAVNGAETMVSLSTEYSFAANDYVECMVQQTSGTTLLVDLASNYSPEFGASYIGN